MSISAISVTIKVTKPNRTEVCIMLNTNYTEKLLELKYVILLNIENTKDYKIVEFKMAQRIHKYPRCGDETSKVHDYRIQDVKDIPSFGYMF
jgi:transposase